MIFYYLIHSINPLEYHSLHGEKPLNSSFYIHKTHIYYILDSLFKGKI